MKLWTHFFLASLLAALLMACSDGSTDNDNDNNVQPGDGQTYSDTFFKVVEENAPNNVIVGTTDLSLSDGQLSGTLNVYDDSADFSGDTGQLSGTLQEGSTQGDKQSYTADLTLDFENAPDYTVSGQVYTVDRGDEQVIFTEQPLTLSKDGSSVGKFILAEDDDGDDNGDDGDNGGENPQPGTPPSDRQTYDDTFFKTVEVNAPYNVVVGEGDLTLSGGQLSGSLNAYDNSGDFPNATGTLSGTLQAGNTEGNKQSYTADLTLDFDGDAPDYTASGQVYTVDRGDEQVIFTQDPMELDKDGSRVGKFILAEDDD